MAILGLLFALNACRSDKTQDKVYGKWQLREVIEPDGSVQPVDTVWYNFQFSLFMYQLYQPSVDGGRYLHRYGFNVPEGDDRLVLELTDDPGPLGDFLPYTDWTSKKRTFFIRRLTGDELILSSDDKQYIFRKS